MNPYHLYLIDKFGKHWFDCYQQDLRRKMEREDIDWRANKKSKRFDIEPFLKQKVDKICNAGEVTD